MFYNFLLILENKVRNNNLVLDICVWKYEKWKGLNINKWMYM